MQFSLQLIQLFRSLIFINNYQQRIMQNSHNKNFSRNNLWDNIFDPDMKHIQLLRIYYKIYLLIYLLYKQTYLEPFNVLLRTNKEDVEIITIINNYGHAYCLFSNYIIFFWGFGENIPWQSQVSQEYPDRKKIPWQSQEYQEYQSPEHPGKIKTERISGSIV